MFRLAGFTCAVFICNDVWHPSLPYLGVTQKADIFITIINSSRDSMGKEFSNIESWRTSYVLFTSSGMTTACCAIDGWTTSRRFFDNTAQPVKRNYRFWGGSEIVNPYGQVIIRANLDQPDSIVGTIEQRLVREKRILLPYRNDDPHFTHRELQRILYQKAI